MLLLLLLKHTSEVNIFFGARLDLLDHGEKFCPKCTRGCLGILIPEQTFFGNSTNGIIIIIDQAADTEDRRMRKIARYQPKHRHSRRSHQRESDEINLLCSSPSDLLNVPDGCPPNCEVVEYICTV
jgi:hypothetical protein